MSKPLRYILHIIVTFYVLAIHYLLFPFKWLYDMTDWKLVTNYKEFK